MWRPFPSLLKFWTPLNSGDGVRFCNFIQFWTPPTLSAGVRSARLSRFGRHLPDLMASIPAVLSNLDASSVNMWRPIYALIAIWTPPTQTHGVRSAQLLQSERHSHSHMASVLHAYHVLDAIHPSHWRPLPAAFPVRTPLIQSHGVQFTRLSPFGRHAIFGRLVS